MFCDDHRRRAGERGFFKKFKFKKKQNVFYYTIYHTRYTGIYTGTVRTHNQQQQQEARGRSCCEKSENHNFYEFVHFERLSSLLGAIEIFSISASKPLRKFTANSTPPQRSWVRRKIKQSCRWAQWLLAYRSELARNSAFSYRTRGIHKDSTG